MAFLPFLIVILNWFRAAAQRRQAKVMSQSRRLLVEDSGEMLKRVQHDGGGCERSEAISGAVGWIASLRSQ
jgi:hypothetical protein